MKTNVVSGNEFESKQAQSSLTSKIIHIKDPNIVDTNNKENPLPLPHPTVDMELALPKDPKAESVIIGVAGPTGNGKSFLINELLPYKVRHDRGYLFFSFSASLRIYSYSSAHAGDQWWQEYLN